MESTPNPIIRQARTTLRTAMIWFGGAIAVAIYAGFSIQPSVSYTVGAAVLGMIWVSGLAIHWRTRRTFWHILSVILLVVAMSVLRDAVFPGSGFLRGIYGLAVAIAAGTLLLRIFRSQFTEFCHLDT